MLMRKCFVIALPIALISCGTQVGTLNFEDKQSVVSPPSEMKIVVDSIPLSLAPAQAPALIPIDPVAQLRNDFAATQAYYSICMAAPKNCDVARITVPQSPWSVDLTRLVHDYSVANIRSRKGSGVALVRIDSLNILDANNAVVNACTYDSMVMVDAGATNSSADDIIFNNAVASYLSTWILKMHNGVWKWFSWTASMTKFNVDQCGFDQP